MKAKQKEGKQRSESWETQLNSVYCLHVDMLVTSVTCVFELRCVLFG